MRNTQLVDKVKVVNAVVPTAGSIGAATATVVDGSAGYDRVMFILSTGAAGTGATMSYKIQSSATSGGTYADVTSAALTALDDTGGSKQYIIDMPVSAAKPYFKVVSTIGTGTFANSSIAVLYRGDSYPVATSYATQLVTL